MHKNFTLPEDFWENIEIDGEDLDHLNSHLLEVETPLTPNALVAELVPARIQREKETAQANRAKAGKSYLPKDRYEVGEKLVFHAFDSALGEVTGSRAAKAGAGDPFDVIEVVFPDGHKREFAMGLEHHRLNEPMKTDETDPLTSPDHVISEYGSMLEDKLAAELQENEDFVYIAGRWFPKALIVDVNIGNLNLAEAVLDMHEGGPIPTESLLKEVGLPEGVNPKLAEFSLDMALQDDKRFDEVGPAGEVAWFLRRVEPQEVLETPLFLRHEQSDYERDLLTEEMINLETLVDDELSPVEGLGEELDEIEVRLIFPHWQVGSLPLTSRMLRFFPTAYESPRIRFMLVDGQSGEKFPGWVVRLEKYVYGLKDWYRERGMMPGSYVKVRRGENPGEVVVDFAAHRANKEWVRTALVGADGGVVYAMLKQPVFTTFDERMMVFMPSEFETLEARWAKGTRRPFEETIVNTMRELAKLNPQSHVHVTELYSAVNLIRRTPPGPIMALLNSRPWFVHVGDLHYRVEGAGEGQD